MTAVCTEWAARHRRVRLADPGRPRRVFTVEQAREAVEVDPVDELVAAWRALLWPWAA